MKQAIFGCWIAAASITAPGLAAAQIPALPGPYFYHPVPPTSFNGAMVPSFQMPSPVAPGQDGVPPPALAVSPQGVPMGVEVQSGNMGVIVSPYGQVIGVVPGQ